MVSVKFNQAEKCVFFISDVPCLIMGLVYMSIPPEGIPLFLFFVGLTINGEENPGRFPGEPPTIVSEKQIMSYLQTEEINKSSSNFSSFKP